MTCKELNAKYIGAEVSRSVLSDLFQDDGDGVFSLSSDRYAGIEALENIFGTNAPAEETDSEWDEELYLSLKGTRAGEEYKRLFAPENQETISDRWINDGITFAVNVKVEDGKILAVQFEKYQSSDGCRPTAQAKRIDHREIDIADRILKYITTP